MLLARGWRDHNRRETRAAKSSEDAAGANLQPAAPGAAASNHRKMMSAGLGLRCCHACRAACDVWGTSFSMHVVWVHWVHFAQGKH